MLGMKAKNLFALIAQAIMADPSGGALVLLGRDLEPILSGIGFPPRTVQERPITTSAS
jgi:hypothetical protein